MPAQSQQSFGPFPDFTTAVTWYALYSRKEVEFPPEFGGGESEEENESEQEQEQEQQAPGQGDEGQSQDNDNDQDSESEPASPSSNDGDNQETSKDEPSEGGEEDSEDQEPDDEEGEEEVETSPDDDGSGDEEPDGDDDFDEGKYSEDGESESEVAESEAEDAEGEKNSEEGQEDEEGEETPAPTPLGTLTDPEYQPPVLTGHTCYPDAEGCENHLREFRSWYDFAIACRDMPPAWPEADRNSQKISKNRDRFTGSSSFEETMQMALYTGWPEGRKLLHEALAIVQPKPKIHPVISLEVAGAFPCVPAFNAGDPSCMFIDPQADFHNTKPIVRIDYNNGSDYTVTAEQLMLRGAAVLSFANALETELGLSTELRIVTNSYSGWGADKKWFRCSVVYKEAGQPLDLDRAAFALAHPSVLRRMILALVEQHQELYASHKRSYGFPGRQPNDPTSGQFGGAIYVSEAQSHETEFSAKDAIQRAAEAVGFQLA